jgi:hypothetical protein
MITRSGLSSTVSSEVRAVGSRNTSQTSEEPMEGFGLLSWLLLSWLLRWPLAQRRLRRLERLDQERKQQLAWRVEGILVGRGLTQMYQAIVGGRGYYVPQVISVLDGPPMALEIRTLPGQTPDDFVKHAQAIAHNLGVAEVRVASLGPSLIRLELVPRA